MDMLDIKNCGLRLYKNMYILAQKNVHSIDCRDWVGSSFGSGLMLKKLFEFDIAAIPEERLNVFRERKEAILDGNHAALSVLTRLVDGLCGYPITPSTPIAEDFAKASAMGQKNLFGT